MSAIGPNPVATLRVGPIDVAQPGCRTGERRQANRKQ